MGDELLQTSQALAAEPGWRASEVKSGRAFVNDRRRNLGHSPLLDLRAVDPQAAHRIEAQVVELGLHL